MSGMLTRAGLRAFSTANLKVVHNVAKQQFTISMHNTEAVLDYDKKGNNITFIHTNVPPQFQGKGAGKLLAHQAFRYAVDNKLDVLCQCHFLCKYYEDNKTNLQPLRITLSPTD